MSPMSAPCWPCDEARLKQRPDRCNGRVSKSIYRSIKSSSHQDATLDDKYLVTILVLMSSQIFASDTNTR
jgi:hypothetical protein